MHFRAALASLAALAGLASATIAPNSPVDGTVCIGGVVCTVSWVEDNTQPLASTFGPTAVGLFVGSQDQQTQVQDFGQVDDPSTTMSMDYTIDANAGPDGSFYFVRFQSISATDDAGTPLQAFSSMFTLAQMTGQLSAEAQAQVDGTTASSSAAAAPASSSSASEEQTAAASSTRMSSSAKSKSSKTAAAEAAADASASISGSDDEEESSSMTGDNPFLGSGAVSLKSTVGAGAAGAALLAAVCALL